MSENPAFHHDLGAALAGAPSGKAPQPCATEGCQGIAEDPRKSEGRHCPACAIDRYLFDRDARWEDHHARSRSVRREAQPETLLGRLIAQTKLRLGFTAQSPAPRTGFRMPLSLEGEPGRETGASSLLGRV